MSQKTIRNLVIFLLINVVLAVYIATNYFIQSKVAQKPKTVPVVAQIQPKVNPQPQPAYVVPTQTPEASLGASVAPGASAPSSFAKTPATVTQTSSKALDQDTAKICVEMGPFNAEEKIAMDFILSENKQADLAKVEKMKAHQLFWNLGKNKVEAEKLFAKQKEGAMASSKFVLAMNKNNDWVVNITKVHGSEDMAKKLLKDLDDKAQKINTGGTWEYTSLPEGFFYKFSDFKALKEVTVNSIDIMLKASKDPC